MPLSARQPTLVISDGPPSLDRLVSAQVTAISDCGEEHDEQRRSDLDPWVRPGG
jgi:hypothetical protein